VSITRAELLGKASRRFKDVHLPTGGTARLRNLSTSEMRSLRGSLLSKDGKLIQSRADRIQQLLVAWCLVDDAGNRILTDDDATGNAMDDIDGAVVACLFAEAKAWSGFGSDSDWSAIEDAAKNSNATTASGSSTA